MGQSLTKWLTVVINEKLREWIQNHPPVQVPSLTNSERLIRILTNRELWITVHHCANKKKTSIICVANHHSLPWNITSMAYKIRTTLKRRWIFERASGNRCLLDAGKTRPPRKQQRRQRQQQQQSCVNTPEDKVQLQKRKASSKGQNLDTDSWMTYVKKILLETLIFKNVYFDTMIDVTVKKREQNELEREFTCEDWSHCLYRRSFKSVNWAIFVQSEDHKRIIHQGMNYHSLQEYNSSTPWIEHEIITLLQKLDWKLYGSGSHSYRRKTDISCTMERAYHLSSSMESVQFVSTTMPAKQK